MTTNGPDRDVLLVGSVPLESAEAVFACCAATLGPRARRLPDGETGERSNWIAWQRDVLRQTQGVEPGPAGYRVTEPPVFGALGYAAAARSSYAVFCKLRDGGTISDGQRFQVSLPTPLAVVALYFDPASQGRAEPPYERALLSELDAILGAVPHEDLALQWDVAIEFAVLEGLRPVAFAPIYDGIIDRLTRLCAAVPADVEMGVHLCYGDAGHKHFKEPDDTALMTRVANDLAIRSPRPIAWIHMPVPRHRDDAEYFAPLAALALMPGTQLFLGLVHASDGPPGTKRRIAAAEAFVSGFGIATECGFGRRDPASIPGLLQLYLDA